MSVIDALTLFIGFALCMSLALVLNRRERKERDTRDVYRGDELDEWMGRNDE